MIDSSFTLRIGGTCDKHPLNTKPCRECEHEAQVVHLTAQAHRLAKESMLTQASNDKLVAAVKKLNRAMVLDQIEVQDWPRDSREALFDLLKIVT